MIQNRIDNYLELGEMVSIKYTVSECSDQYSGFQQGDIPHRIVERLLELGKLQPSDSVLEIGSGPGTYSLEIAPRVRILTCMDTSPRMLDRLMSSAREKGFSNIERFEQDWSTYVPRKGYFTCMATLCPGTGTPESLMRMEGAAKRSCVIVSWIENHGDDLNSEIWHMLGKDYGYEARRSTGIPDWLSDNGRDPMVETFETTIEADMRIEDIIAKERSAFSAYGLENRIEDIVMDILGPSLDDGILHYRATNSMRMICWDVLDKI